MNILDIHNQVARSNAFFVPVDVISQEQINEFEVQAVLVDADGIKATAVFFDGELAIVKM